MTNSKTTRVQLTLHAQRLPNVAGFGKGISDPYAVVTLIASDPADKPRVLGQTEVVKNSLSPHWAKTFLIEYEFGKPARINVGIYDEIKKAKTNKPMGSAVFEIGEILGARGNVKAKKLKNGGTVFARVQKAPEGDAGTLHFSMRGVKLKNVDGLFGKSDPFFEVSRLIQASGGPTWQLVYRSKHINDNLNPKWEPVSIGINELCDGDMDKAILVTVKDWEKNGKHTPMGSFETTVNGLVNSKTQSAAVDVRTVDTHKSFHLRHRGKEYGMIVVTAVAVVPDASSSASPSAGAYSAPKEDTNEVPFSMALDVPPPSQRPSQPYSQPTPAAAANAPKGRRPKFIDYISGGCELQMSVAIDFTGSNGDPRKPGTLHYIHRDGQLNDYEKALSAVGSIVAKYDSDQKFPVWGFGAKFHGQINHCFQLGRDPEASGISGILEAYRSAFKTGLTMSGPTIFAEVIGLAAAQAQSAQDAARKIGQQAYSVLLILTDGAVSDIQGTKRAIIEASNAPLSIVIVGIGNADFSAMQFLDDFQAQEGISRDICQFVEFSKHKHNKISLTQATLDEIPEQLVDYFTGKGIAPLAEITGSKVNVVADEYDEEQDIDLSMGYNSEGEICLEDSQASGCMYDDTSYGDVGTYAGLAVLPAPQQRVAPSQPVAPVQPAAPLGQPTAPVAVAAAPVFHVQVPANVTPGMQLQVQNPSTGQMMIVTVPQGVVPGGTFAVSYS